VQELRIAGATDRRQIGTLADDIVTGILEREGIDGSKVQIHYAYNTDKLVTSIDLVIPEKQLAVELKLSPEAIRERQEAKHLFVAFEKKYAYARVYAERVKEGKPYILISRNAVLQIGKQAGWRALGAFIHKATALGVLVTLLKSIDAYAHGEASCEDVAKAMARESVPGMVVEGIIDIAPAAIQEIAPMVEDSITHGIMNRPFMGGDPRQIR
jgi:hypothetical protein